jgi:hypothetical protein
MKGVLKKLTEWPFSCNFEIKSFGKLESTNNCIQCIPSVCKEEIKKFEIVIDVF